MILVWFIVSIQLETVRVNRKLHHTQFQITSSVPDFLISEIWCSPPDRSLTQTTEISLARPIYYFILLFNLLFLNCLCSNSKVGSFFILLTFVVFIFSWLMVRSPTQTFYWTRKHWSAQEGDRMRAIDSSNLLGSPSSSLAALGAVIGTLRSVVTQTSVHVQVAHHHSCIGLV